MGLRVVNHGRVYLESLGTRSIRCIVVIYGNKPISVLASARGSIWFTKHLDAAKATRKMVF